MELLKLIMNLNLDSEIVGDKLNNRLQNINDRWMKLRTKSVEIRFGYIQCNVQFQYAIYNVCINI